jgi:hypothetical protein
MTDNDEQSIPSRGSVANHSAFPNSWIPVTERLPDECERVMVCNAIDGWVTIGSRELTGTYHHWDGDDYEELCAPTHWMPLPSPPTDSK